MLSFLIFVSDSTLHAAHLSVAVAWATSTWAAIPSRVDLLDIEVAFLVGVHAAQTGGCLFFPVSGDGPVSIRTTETV